MDRGAAEGMETEIRDEDGEDDHQLISQPFS